MQNNRLKIWIPAFLAANALVWAWIHFSHIAFLWPGEFNVWIRHNALPQGLLYLFSVSLLTFGMANLFSNKFRWKMFGFALLILAAVALWRFEFILDHTEMATWLLPK